MRLFHAVILALSIFSPLHSLALEKISDDEETVLDFSNGAPIMTGELQQTPSSHQPSQQPKRLSTTNHISLGVSTASNSKQDGYSVTSIKSSSFSVSTRLFHYFSLFGSKGNGGSRAEYEQLFVSGPFLSNEYYTYDIENETDSSSYNAGIRVDLFGMAASTPYITASRSKIEQSSEVTVIAKRYNYPAHSNNTPLETVTTIGDGGDFADYLTSWSVGYERMLGSNISVSGAFSHAFNDDVHSRSFGVALHVWLSRHLAMGVGVSRNHDNKNDGGGFNLSLAL